MPDQVGRMAGPGDLELIGLAVAGDRDAFDALVRPRLDRSFRLAMAITRSEPDARDATQDACIHVWRELPRLRDRDRFDPWFDQVLVNAARMVVRGRGRRRIREVAVAEAGVSAGQGDGRTGDVARLEPAVPAETDRVADADSIRRAFGHLDDMARTLLVLHHVEGRPLAEIGRLTGSPVGTVKWRLSRARAALGRALEVESR